MGPKSTTFLKTRFSKIATLLTAALLSLFLFLFTLSLIFEPARREALLTPTPAYAAGASLYLYPSSGTKYKDSYFSTYVMVNTGGNAANAYRSVITYPTDKLWITSVSAGGSICTLQIPPSPSYSNNQGRAIFECGNPSAYNGSAGRIGTITFLAKNTGTATIRVANGSQVKKADGKGTEILTSKGIATLIIKKPPTAAPKISSSTHPDQNAWYSKRTVKLSWTKPSGTDGFSYALTQSKKTVPNNVSEGKGTSKTYKNLGDGRWYFHIKAHSEGGWSAVRRFRIQIDTQAPKKFTIVSDPPADQEIDRAPTLYFSTTDEPSGIDHYEISINGSTPLTTTSPYNFYWVTSGTYEVTVKAVDKAGNSREATITLNIKHVPPPTITSPTEGELIPLFEPLVVKGKVAEPGTLELLLDGEIITTIEIGESLSFEYRYTDFLHPWDHKLTAVFITAGRIRGTPVEIGFKVDPRAVSLFGYILPGWLVYSCFIVIIILLLLLLLLLLLKRRKRKKELDEETDRIEKELDKDLDKIDEQLEQCVDKVLQDGGRNKLKAMERCLRKRIKEADKEIQKDLHKNLEKIKGHPERSRRKRLRRRLKRISKKVEEAGQTIRRGLHQTFEKIKIRLKKRRKRIKRRLKKWVKRLKG